MNWRNLNLIERLGAGRARFSKIPDLFRKKPTIAVATNRLVPGARAKVSGASNLEEQEEKTEISPQQQRQELQADLATIKEERQSFKERKHELEKKRGEPPVYKGKGLEWFIPHAILIKHYDREFSKGILEIKHSLDELKEKEQGLKEREDTLGRQEKKLQRLQRFETSRNYSSDRTLRIGQRRVR